MNTDRQISLQPLTENPLLDSSAPSKRVLEVRVTAPPRETPGKRPPLNLSLVLDRSGSMHGAKLENVKQAAGHVLDLLSLSEGNRVSVVTYDDKISILAESALLTPQVRDELKRRIHNIPIGGSTNLSGGWLVGCEQVAKYLSTEGGQIDRTLLLTDGLANVGITDVEELAKHARQLAERGVTTSTFGVGEGFNEQLLEVMANNGGGSFYYIISPVDIPDKFAQEFGELMAVTASGVEITLTVPDQVQMTVLGNWRSDIIEHGARRISLGSLSASQEKNLYCSLEFPPGSEAEQVVLGVTVRGRSENGDILESQADLTFTYASPQEVQAAGEDQALLQRAAKAVVSHVSSEALKLERRGLANQAEKMLWKTIQDQQSYLDETTRQQYENMALQIKAGMDEASRKQAHYQGYLDRQQRVDPHFQARIRSEQTDSVHLLRQLLQDHTVRVEPDPLLWQAPAALPASIPFDRVEGMLLGGAIGDALGNSIEGMLPPERQKAFGEVRDYRPNRHAGGQPVGLPSDDTQLTFWTVEVLLREGWIAPDALAQRFTQERIFGIGSTVKEFIRAYKDQGRSWDKAGQESAGNGAAMRIAPVLLPYLRRPSAGLWADAILDSMVTHNDYASNAACAALAGMYWELLGMDKAPAPEWWAETFYRIAAPLEGKTSYSSRRPNLNYRGSVSDFVRQELKRAQQEGWSTLQAGETWGSGAYLLETLPTALYILTRYGDDPEQAIVRAVNDTKDNDTIAAIIGAAVGALHGKSALPERWITGLLGRTNERNDGHIFRLIEEVKRRFW